MLQFYSGDVLVDFVDHRFILVGEKGLQIKQKGVRECTTGRQPFIRNTVNMFKQANDELSFMVTYIGKKKLLKNTKINGFECKVISGDDFTAKTGYILDWRDSKEMKYTRVEGTEIVNKTIEFMQMQYEKKLHEQQIEISVLSKENMEMRAKIGLAEDINVRFLSWKKAEKRFFEIEIPDKF